LKELLGNMEANPRNEREEIGGLGRRIKLKRRKEKLYTHLIII
jgi:hypothetical protein